MSSSRVVFVRPRIRDAFGRHAFIFFEEFVGEQEEYSADDKHVSNNVNALKQQVDIVADEQSDHCCGYEGNEKLSVEVERLKEPLPVKNNYRKDGAKLNGDGEQFRQRLIGNAHKGRTDDNMASGGHRKEFRYPLDNGKYD